MKINLINVMGTKDCYECQETKKKLNDQGVPHIFIDIEENTSEELRKTLLRASAEGYRMLPIIEIYSDKQLPMFKSSGELFNMLKEAQ